MDIAIHQAVEVMRSGGVIAYPTEYCFGLGCDPDNADAVQKILGIKHRSVEQGVLLIAADTQQVAHYVDFTQVRNIAQIERDWPGPITWVLPAKGNVPHWIKGAHSGVAMRVSAHPLCQELCEVFGKAIVSTSANRHGAPSLVSVEEVRAEFSNEVDFILEGSLGGATAASKIFDDTTGMQLR